MANQNDSPQPSPIMDRIIYFGLGACFGFMGSILFFAFIQTIKRSL